MLRISRFFAVLAVVICLSGMVSAQAEVDRIYFSPDETSDTFGYVGWDQYWWNYNTVTVDRLTHRLYAPGRGGKLIEIDPISREMSFRGPIGYLGRIVVDHDAQVRYAPARDYLWAIDASGTEILYPTPAPYILRGYAIIDEIRDRVYLEAERYYNNSPPPGEVILSFNTVDKTWSTIPTSDDRCVKMDLNPSNGRIYCVALTPERGGEPSGVLAIDPADPNALHRIEFPFGIAVSDIAVNPTTNKIYSVAVNRYSETTPEGDWSIVVINGSDHSFVHVPFGGFPGFMGVAGGADNSPHMPAVVINPLTNRVYTMSVTFNNWGTHNAFPSLVILDGSTNAVSVKTVPYQPAAGNPQYYPLGNEFGMAIDPVMNRLYVPLHESHVPTSLWVIDPGDTGAVSADNPVVQADATVLDFGAADVTGVGTVSVVPISDPAAAGDIPGGFAISDVLAYEITPDANLQFSGPVTTCFKVPQVNDESEFNSLAVLHREETSPGVFGLVDRTSSHNFETRTICATTTSFSPFYLVRIGNRINPLFDRSRAYRSGSTIPVKLQLLNQSGSNISSASTTLSVRSLRKVGSSTALGVNHSGNANPDSNFRFVGGDSYVFNLSTQGLASGRYVLSFYAGNDHSFFHTLEFQIR